MNWESVSKNEMRELITRHIYAEAIATFYGVKSDRPIRHRIKALNLWPFYEEVKSKDRLRKKHQRLIDLWNETKSLAHVRKTFGDYSDASFYDSIKRLAESGLIEFQGKCETCQKSFSEIDTSVRFCSIRCSRSFATLNLTDEQKKARSKGFLDSEIRKRNSENNRGKWTSERKAAHSVRMTSVMNRPEVKQKLSKAFTGRKLGSDFSEKAREAQLKLLAEGKHRGWKNPGLRKESYAEAFWRKVLEDAGVNFRQDRKLTKKDGLGDETKATYYLLDFEIILNEIKIDLEIDGKQHFERTITDDIRDRAVSSAGYLVKRIPWINPTTKIKSKMVKNQILDLENFIFEASGLKIKLSRD